MKHIQQDRHHYDLEHEILLNEDSQIASPRMIHLDITGTNPPTISSLLKNLTGEKCIGAGTYAVTKSLKVGTFRYKLDGGRCGRGVCEFLRDVRDQRGDRCC